MPETETETTITYVGERTPQGAVVWVEASTGGQVRRRWLRPFPRHGDGTFEWGYGGSGPADLARALLKHATGSVRLAEEWHQDFKWAVVAGLPREGFRLPRQAVTAWIERTRSIIEAMREEPDDAPFFWHATP